ncbi:hypothetical protein HUW75_03930 [Fusobacterium polymorphum]|jgi:hypothetical protein|uniref:hypothetical protein n=1 Tax=Fusobacterium nucleatum subsp. polymorphum TaxID=76857 RepID=UPI0020503207|nr:MAG TPA: hypothetical protein [Caudoviricetes sp.]DAP86950.1 MAG TPA: hypothetical protein [Caudoviricetes sp.]DAQ62866.1 MAG TPA: hypothetical protein [Caudoviricetes sp.]DAR72684.1 MAG TPA: hypothetical protein [Caudoviricetes sp.]DAX18077.1 MAG TPA: hypothetical protein [Caudoviricetes sp.]
MATKTKKDDEVLYSKEQIIASKKYSNRKDILNVLLKDDEEYSFSRIDEIIENFMNKEVQ